MNNRSCFVEVVLPLVLFGATLEPSHPRLAFGSLPNQVSTQAAKAPSIRDLWQEKVKALNPRTKNYPDDKINVLQDLLDESHDKEVEAELARIRSSPTPYAEMGDYDKTLLQAFVSRFVHRKDKRQLVYLLSAKFPPYVAIIPTELFLGINAKDNILLLFDSYERATDTDNRADMLAVMARIFRTLRQRHRDDDEFIKQSRDWYLRNRNRIYVNSYYEPRNYGPITGDFFRFRRGSAR